MGWQPFCIVERFDNKLEEEGSAYIPFSYISLFNVYYNDYMHIYILKHTINDGDWLSVCDICILCIV